VSVFTPRLNDRGETKGGYALEGSNANSVVGVGEALGKDGVEGLGVRSQVVADVVGERVKQLHTHLPVFYVLAVGALEEEVEQLGPLVGWHNDARHDAHHIGNAVPHWLPDECNTKRERERKRLCRVHTLAHTRH
jgi:hypothetical protein